MGEQVVNDDTFYHSHLTTSTRGIYPLTQASIPIHVRSIAPFQIKHCGTEAGLSFAVVFFMQAPMSRCVHSFPGCPQGEFSRLFYIASFGNMILISKQEHYMVGSMQQHILDRKDTRLFASIKKCYLEYQKNGTDSLSAILSLSQQHVKGWSVLLRDDWVIQSDHCRELLDFWCFGAYTITSMIDKYRWRGFGKLRLPCIFNM
ncbi:predicted protein [Lichtheimia corymbifera JMRC:FSU:9682]|uniref:Uncharacterized protein n=1 Tax=Lichtheimia corymbifera JMRC:FSU:9682 TaxID=1263082 RepID=A0A068SDK4_9FUNG|nr:predicted protein [Lichtheimia corymbifera JMRC:FSU:9682]